MGGDVAGRRLSGAVDTASFDYDLPTARIAQVPVEPRDSARLLVDRGPGFDGGVGSGPGLDGAGDAAPSPDDRRVRDLADLLEPGDLVVVNRTRVLPARLLLQKRTGGTAEVFLLEPADGGAIAASGPQRWIALVRPGRRLPTGTVVTHPSGPEVLAVEIGAHLGDGRREVELRPGPDGDLLAAIEAAGAVPLPPYITTPLEDPDRYQTVYGGHAWVDPDSVAAPTAGLHLTEELTDRLASRGIELATVELAVGIGTFRPILSDKVEDHVMHAERYRIDPATWEQIQAARRVVAVGTTTVRALESAAATGQLRGRTELFVHGDYPFRVVDRLLTNFHQPRSSLLVLIDAFAGPRWRQLYAHALAGPYRFLSFGDAMLLTRHDRWSTP